MTTSTLPVVPSLSPSSSSSTSPQVRPNAQQLASRPRPFSFFSTSSAATTTTTSAEGRPSTLSTSGPRPSFESSLSNVSPTSQSFLHLTPSTAATATPRPTSSHSSRSTSTRRFSFNGWSPSETAPDPAVYREYLEKKKFNGRVNWAANLAFGGRTYVQSTQPVQFVRPQSARQVTVAGHKKSQSADDAFSVNSSTSHFVGVRSASTLLAVGSNPTDPTAVELKPFAPRKRRQLSDPNTVLAPLHEVTDSEAAQILPAPASAPLPDVVTLAVEEASNAQSVTGDPAQELVAVEVVPLLDEPIDTEPVASAAEPTSAEVLSTEHPAPTEQVALSEDSVEAELLVEQSQEQQTLDAITSSIPEIPPALQASVVAQEPVEIQETAQTEEPVQIQESAQIRESSQAPDTAQTQDLEETKEQTQVQDLQQIREPVQVQEPAHVPEQHATMPSQPVRTPIVTTLRPDPPPTTPPRRNKMGILRAFTKRAKRDATPSESTVSSRPSRPQISLPISLISTTYKGLAATKAVGPSAPQEEPAQTQQDETNKSPISPSHSSHTSSSYETDTSTTEPNLTDGSSIASTPPLSPVDRKDYVASEHHQYSPLTPTTPNHDDPTIASADFAEPQIVSPDAVAAAVETSETATEAPSVPAIPKRAPSHTRREHIRLSRARTIRRSLVLSSADADGYADLEAYAEEDADADPDAEYRHSTASVAPLYSSQQYLHPHPFSHELSQLDAVAEEFAHAASKATAAEDVEVMHSHGLVKWDASDYLEDIAVDAPAPVLPGVLREQHAW